MTTPSQPQAPHASDYAPSDRERALQATLHRLDESEQSTLDRLFDFLKIPSVSTDPAFHTHCLEAAEWCAGQLRELGFEASVRRTEGKPMVVAHYRPDDGAPKPHILFYGHYDVQPPDPLDEWDTPPFEPHIADHPVHGKVITARGASDDKGQVMTFIEACRAFIETAGTLPVAVTVLLEGEEESGSPSLMPFLAETGDELKADIALVCDTNQWDGATPAITAFLRGLAFSEVTVHGPSRDLHSGLYGGPVRNPIQLLCSMLGELHDPNGRIQIPGFYDRVSEPTEEQRKEWQALGFDETEFLAEIGLVEPAGEDGYSLLEQLWARPTVEINGIHGGYTGVGSKTVIPAQASAKISFRLVPGQDPKRVISGFHQFIDQRLPHDARAHFTGEGGAPAVGFNLNSAPFMAATKALQDEWEIAPVRLGCGASIPIVESFRSSLDMDALLIGFALPDDRIHAPNEKYNLTSFRKGARSWARIMSALGEGKSDVA